MEQDDVPLGSSIGRSKSSPPPPPDEIFVRADEIDETGADIATMALAEEANVEEDDSVDELGHGIVGDRDDTEMQDRVHLHQAQQLLPQQSQQSSQQQTLGRPSSPEAVAGSSATQLPTGQQPVRPILRRDDSTKPPPPPPRQPPPPAPPAAQRGENGRVGVDPLDLNQLRDIVTNLPKLDATAYAYTHDDTRTFAEELEEWFQYTEEDRSLLDSSYEGFEASFDEFMSTNEAPVVEPGMGWCDLPAPDKEIFIRQNLEEIRLSEAPTVTRSLHCLTYIAMGAWKETASQKASQPAGEEEDFEPPNDRYLKNIAQLNLIKESTQTLCELGAAQVIFELVRTVCEEDRPYYNSQSSFVSPIHTQEEAAEMLKQSQLAAGLTVLYFMVESGRWQLRRHNEDSIRQSFVELRPGILRYLIQLVAKLRWDDSSTAPFTRILLLLWKSLLLLVGGIAELEETKKALRAPGEPDKDSTENLLTASPLDYHVFRQEITSKYPAYKPPPPLVPLELHETSILPPLPSSSTHPSRTASHDGLHDMVNGASKSIFHQPVHISTPAPSPPPSPAGPGGKGGRKQNYQTNQNFPFLYPPLDSSSNNLGGKGGAELQDKLVGKKWEGSDVPTSILEAAQLFASRMRMSRSLRQLWEVREDFIKFDRGWGEKEKHRDRAEGNTFGDDSSIGKTDEEQKEGEIPDEWDPEIRKPVATKPAKSTFLKESDDKNVQERLNIIESFYREALPQLQSIVIVLLKILLSNITVLGSQTNGERKGRIIARDPNGNEIEETRPLHNLNLSQNLTSMTNGSRREGPLDAADWSIEDLNNIRTREVTSKAITGFLLLLLKWLRVSHVLKFEYMTQLLLDSNFLPLALKYFALQNIDKAVDKRNDDDNLGFFRLCFLHAGNIPTPPSSSPSRPASRASSSEDEAAPPPIARERRSSSAGSREAPQIVAAEGQSQGDGSPSPPPPPRRPEVDELGYPTTVQPPHPLTTYAPRFFATHIATLRVLQKLTKHHSHRALLLVQYKSSTMLRKNLKVPQPQLRRYTLKLFKSQVPYCGRKWRQANMRVITAIYVFCRMGLRDDWISAGGAVEEWVDGAIGTERAWRGLVGWWHAQRYRDYLLGRHSTDGSGGGGDGNGDAEGIGDEELLPLDDENDFFVRELDRMGWGVGGLVDELVEEEEAGAGAPAEPEPGTTEWEGGLLQMES